mgnify:FL=1
MAFRGFLFGLFVYTCFAGTLWAHDPGISTAQGRLRAGVLELTVGFAPADAQQLLPPEARTSGKWTQNEFDAARELLTELAPHLWAVSVDGIAIAPRETRVQLAAGDSLNFALVYARPKDGPLKLRALKLGDLPSGHREFVVIADERGLAVAKKLLSAGNDTVEIPAAVVALGTAQPATNQAAQGYWAILKLGFEQMWTGFGHLTFMVALLLACRSFRSVLTINLCFTLSYLLTLTLAALKVANPPSRIVEAAIAASIVFLGIENIARRGAEPGGRRALTLAFGLLHGFGFAIVVPALSVHDDGRGLVMPLGMFILGVGFGQAVIGSVLLSTVWWRRRAANVERFGLPVLSGILSTVGLYWFLGRIFFS